MLSGWYVVQQLTPEQRRLQDCSGLGTVLVVFHTEGLEGGAINMLAAPSACCMVSTANLDMLLILSNTETEVS